MSSHYNTMDETTTNLTSAADGSPPPRSSPPTSPTNILTSTSQEEYTSMGEENLKPGSSPTKPPPMETIPISSSLAPPSLTQSQATVPAVATATLATSPAPGPALATATSPPTTYTPSSQTSPTSPTFNPQSKISSPPNIDFNYESSDHSGDESPMPMPSSYQSSGMGNANGNGPNSPPSSSSPSNRQILQQTHEGEHRNDFGQGLDVPVSKATYIFVLCAALNSCNLGYDIGVNTNAAKLLQNSMDLSDTKLEIFMGSLNMFAMIGALCASSISDRFGRRGGFVFAAVIFVFGIFIMTLASNYVTLMFGRTFVGLGVGFGLAIDPLYISEISPAAHRGRLVTWSEIATNVGVVFGFCSGLIFYNVDEDVAWRLMFSLGGVLPIVLIFLVKYVMPESPRWLVLKGREEEAKEILRTIYPPGFDVDTIVKGIEDALKREIAAEQAVGWDVIFFPSPAFRRMLLVGLGTAIAQQLVGIDAIQYFLEFIIDESGVEGRAMRSLVLIFLGMLKLTVIVLAGKLFDKSGRRPLFKLSLIGMFVSLLIVAFTFFAEGGNSFIAIFGLAIYLCFFSLGMGPGCWLIPSEVFANSVRAKAMSLATFLNRAFATLMSSTFLTAVNIFTWGGYFLMLAFVCVLTFMFFHYYLPETKGRSLEDMSTYFAEITGDRSILDAERRLQASQPEEGRNAEEGRRGTLT